MPGWIRAANAGMSVLLLYAAFVQHNDPDPIPWIALYGSASLCAAVVGIRGRLPWQAAAVIALVALTWSAWWATGVIGQQPLFEEEGRETMGLAIAGAWMALDAAALRRFHSP